MQNHLIALDLDGTTLTSAGTVTPYTRRVLQAASNAGHIVAIVSGRPYRMCTAIYDELGLTSPMINFNGALGSIPHQHWEGEYTETIDPQIALAIEGAKEELNLKIVSIESKFRCLVDRLNYEVDEFFPLATRPDQLLRAENIQNDPLSIMLIADNQKTKDATVAALETRFGNQIHVGVWGGPRPILELSRRGVSKTTGIKHLMATYHIPRGAVVAFGDEHNDAEMLSFAGHGVAMHNATPQIKAVADAITPQDNDYDGMAHYLADYLHLTV